MDEEAAVAGTMGRSRRMLADMYDQGSSILANMAGNREVIKVGGWGSVLGWGLQMSWQEP
jgi:hypothetical protein